MINWLLAPPIAFLLYILLVSLLSLAGRYLAGETQSSSTERSLYTGGEKLPTMLGVPGYRPFFVIALFFAVLHLGMLVLGSGGLTLLTGIYLFGLLLALLALIMG